MSNIAVVTLFGLKNFGNNLQMYAMQQALLQLGKKAVILKPTPKKDFRQLLKKFGKFFLKKDGNVISFKNTNDYITDLRRKHFKKFVNCHIKYRTIYSSKSILPDTLNQEYDFFIVGSDQVWNTTKWDEEKNPSGPGNFLLRFVMPEKRISYAASFGRESLPLKSKKIMAEELKKFKAISVREQCGAAIIRDLLDIDVPIVLDPTMLLTAEQWREIETHNLNGNKKYILTYFLGPQPPEVLAEVQNAAASMKAEIIELMNPKSKYYILSPDGFLEMIDHAQAVFTDSFHGSIFSILFHTPFKIYERSLDGYPSMNCRIDTLLSKTQLTHCIQSNQFPTEEDFVKADKLLEMERESSMQFLRSALSNI